MMDSRRVSTSVVRAIFSLRKRHENYIGAWRADTLTARASPKLAGRDFALLFVRFDICAEGPQYSNVLSQIANGRITLLVWE
jgi:hypothetical protein